MICPELQAAGENIEFVPCEALDEARTAIYDIIRSVATRSTGKHSSDVFVLGASGSGKTRIGWHAFKTLGQPPMRPGHADHGLMYLHSLWRPALAGYIYIDLQSLWEVQAEIERSESWTTVPQTRREIKHRRSTDKAAASRAFKRLLLENNQTSKLSHDDEPLHLLLTEWATAIREQASQENAARLPVCLIIHIDEFQAEPWASACLTRAIRNAHEDLDTEHNVSAVSLLTGLSAVETKWYLKDTGFIPGFATHNIHVQPLVPMSSAAMQVAINAYNADVAAHVRGRGALQPPALTPDHFEEIPQLRLLLEAAGGWTLGLVRLGAATASRAVLKSAICDVDWSIVEQDTCDAVRIWLETQISRTHVLLELSAAAWPKLLLFTMAPFEVRE